MFAWLKVFTDGTAEQGTAAQVRSGLASWTKGRLTDIDKVHLASAHPPSLSIISVPNTNWHQFERYMFDLSTGGSPTPVLSCVQAEIKDSHVGMYLSKKAKDSYVFFISIESIKEKDSVIITDDLVGKWLTVISHKKGKPYYIITDKGKFK